MLFDSCLSLIETVGYSKGQPTPYSNGSKNVAFAILYTKDTDFGGSDVVSVACFCVRASVIFHFMFVHYTLSSVWVAEWPHFGKQLPARLAICSHCLLSICNIYLFPVLVLRAGFAF